MRNDLWMEDDDDVRKHDFTDFVDGLIRNTDLAFNGCHPLFRSVERHDGAFTASIDDGGTENMRASDDTLAPDTCHPNIESLCHD